MGLFDGLTKKIRYDNKDSAEDTGTPVHEFCPRCEANLKLQKGYDNSLPYWVCRGCGEMLLNPSVPGNTAWICDNCAAMLNIQQGFKEDCGSWTCTECGFVNEISESEIYSSEDEFRDEFNSPYKGLSEDAMRTLALYDEEGFAPGREGVIFVRNMSDGRLYVKKLLSIYDKSVYDYLKDNPVAGMPKICEVFESDNGLIVIEEYIEGRTLFDIINESPLAPDRAVDTALQICRILKDLHSRINPIIHRDIKPSNVILSESGRAYLLDMNAAKWYKAGEKEDTEFLGTQYYAAPEQVGYGFTASSVKSDIYAMGMLLNVMVTGKFPKEEKAPDRIWKIVEKCIILEPEGRLSDDELIAALENCSIF